jgi:hypothetical protein
MQVLRVRIGLAAKDFRGTLGYKNTDIHGVKKG